MKKTLFRQLLAYLLIFCIALCAACYVVIGFFFGDYYQAQQRNLLIARTQEWAGLYDAGQISDIETSINDYYSEYGVSMHFLDQQTGQVTGLPSQGMGRQAVSSIMSDENLDKWFVSTSGSSQGKGQGAKSEWLSYLTQTADGSRVLGRISYASIDAVVATVQQFFLYFGIALAAAFIVFALVFSRSVSRPLHALNAIAAEMGRLNFSMRYTGKRRDEIGQLGATLNALTTRLENTITQLTAELSKEKTLDKMRKQFTAQVSHELQTPLSVIRGYAEALADHVYEGREADAAYRTLLSETERISHMVDDLLDLSQMEAGAYVVRKETFRPAELLKRVCERAGALQSGYTVRLDMDYPEDRPYFGDPLRLEQALRNILTNAAKHVTGGGLIRVRLFLKEDMTHITVSNDGKPIDEADLPHIFESYYQGGGEIKGTGLGLAITRHIIALHDGTIRAYNTPEGVTFEIVLP